MTDINQIVVKGRQPLLIPDQLSKWLMQMGMDSNVVELYGPAIHDDNIDVYGYFVSDMQCILRPIDLQSEGVDVETLESELGDWSNVRNYILSFSDIVDMKSREYCHIDKNDYNSIIEQDIEETNDFYFKKLYKRALRFNWKTVAKHLDAKPSEHLTWKEIWNLFHIENYNLVRDENYIIETKSFIVYLHLPQYETRKDEKVIFRYYCNKDSIKTMAYVLLSEAFEKKESDVLDSEYKLLPIKEYTSRLFEKPIVKFDGETYQLPSGQEGFFGSNFSFGYKFDGIYKVIGTDDEKNFVIERIDKNVLKAQS